MRAAGLDDLRPQALALMARLSFPALYDPTAPFLGLDESDHALLEAFYDEGPGVIDTLIRLGALRAMILPSLGASPSPFSDPDHHAELPENVSPYGRVLTAIPDRLRYRCVTLRIDGPTPRSPAAA
jgi:3-oxosteroid 1-dehydrogenase